MIYYFTGTGNSWQAAKALADLTSDVCCPIPQEHSPHFERAARHAVLGLVFPIHAWGPPQVVLQAVQRHAAMWKKEMDKDRTTTHYIYAVMTCGDDTGRTDQLLRRALQAQGLQLHACYAVQMRNTYVCLPGFNTDDAATEARKDAAFSNRMAHIARSIRQHAPAAASEELRGAWAWTKTYVLRPLFERCLMNDRHFRTDAARCTHCGRCARLCPVRNISLASADGLPTWQGHCTQCLACLHGCPTRAIDYGPFTHSKGRVTVTCGRN